LHLWFPWILQKNAFYFGGSKQDHIWRYEDVPKKLMDNFYPDLHVRDIAFAFVWNVLAADENKSVNRPSMN
jgi:hypothetical protein